MILNKIIYFETKPPADCRGGQMTDDRKADVRLAVRCSKIGGILEFLLGGYTMADEHKEQIRIVDQKLIYGGGCINDTIIHLASTSLGFGGTGESGIGRYHGKYGFEAFSHTKSIVDKKCWLDLPMRYAPYQNRLYNRLIRLFLR